MTYAWLLPVIPAVGVIGILIALRFFPTPKISSGQYELDFDEPSDYARARRTGLAHISGQQSSAHPKH